MNETREKEREMKLLKINEITINIRASHKYYLLNAITSNPSLKKSVSVLGYDKIPR